VGATECAVACRIVGRAVPSTFVHAPNGTLEATLAAPFRTAVCASPTDTMLSEPCLADTSRSCLLEAALGASVSWADVLAPNMDAAVRDFSLDSRPPAGRSGFGFFDAYIDVDDIKCCWVSCFRCCGKDRVAAPEPTCSGPCDATGLPGLVDTLESTCT
jgi:hypothetical protein